MRIIHDRKNYSTSEVTSRALLERDDDVYAVYNLMAVGDRLTTTTMRNVVHSTSTGSVEKTRTKLLLTIMVEKIEFDAERCSLRVSGRNLTESDKIKIGQYQSMDIAAGTDFTLVKYDYDGLYESSSEGNSIWSEFAKVEVKDYVIVVPMQFGLASVCLVSSDATLTIARIERSIPKKRVFVNGRDKAIDDFFRDIYSALHKQVMKLSYRCTVVLGSPGFLNSDFLDYALATASKNGHAEMTAACQTKFVTCHTSSGFQSAVAEVFSNPEVQGKVEGLKMLDQVKALNLFHDTLREDEDRACYGRAEVFYALGLSAIRYLLITDTVYRPTNPDERLKMKTLMESVESTGGIVYRFSSRHVTGQELDNYTGIAAILQYPVPGLYELVASEVAESMNKKDSKITVDTKSIPSSKSAAGGAAAAATDDKAIDDDKFYQSLLQGLNTVSHEEFDEFDVSDELDELGDEILRQNQQSRQNESV